MGIYGVSIIYLFYMNTYMNTYISLIILIAKYCSKFLEMKDAVYTTWNL